MQIAVLCGGQATRLYPVTQTIAKSMVEVAGKPFLEQQINLFKKNQIFDIVLCTGFLSEQIEEYFGDGKKFGVSIKYSREREKLDTGGALKNAAALLDEEFFIIYGDSYLTNDYQDEYRYFKKRGLPGLMTVCKNQKELNHPSNVIIRDGLVYKYGNDGSDNPEMIYIDYGLTIFKKSVLDLIDKKVFSMNEYFQRLITEKQLLAFESPVRFYEMGRPETLQETSDFIERNNLSS